MSELHLRTETERLEAECVKSAFTIAGMEGELNRLKSLCIRAADALERYKQAFHQHPYDELIAQLRKAAE